MSYSKLKKCSPLYVLSLLVLPIEKAKAAWTMVDGVENVPTNFDNALVNIINYILGFIASLAVLFLIWGGIQYLTSAGNQDTVRSGKDTLKYGLIGLVVAGLAYAIVNVIISVILVN